MVKKINNERKKLIKQKMKQDWNIDFSLENIFPNTNTIYKNLVLSSGSIQGISHAGAIKKLVSENILDLRKLKSVAGVSAGALFAILIALGFTIDEIWEFIYQLDFSKLISPDFMLFFQKCGFDTGQIVYNLLEQILTGKTGIKHINFRQLYDITKMHLIIVGTCLTTKEAVYFDHINTPFFKVSTAIRISIGIPGFFTPVVIDGKQYIDGAIMNNFPIDLYKNELSQTIGIYIHSDYNTEYKWPEQYLMAVVNLFMDNYFNKSFKKYENNVVVVEGVHEINTFNFGVTNLQKTLIYSRGVAAAEKFIEKLKPKIIEGDF